MTLLWPLLASAQPLSDPLVLATWNLRWLNSAGQAPGASLEGLRSHADLEKLKGYAQRLDADLIALQEVGDKQSAQRIFSAHRYQLLIAGEEDPDNLQKVALAIRKPLRPKRYPDYRELANSGGRIGLDVGVPIAQDKELRLLVVHLKSGCYSNRQQREPKKALTCARFAQDVAWIERWIDLRAQEGGPFVVLGDFNRRLGADGDLVMAEFDDQDPPSLQLHLAHPVDASSCQVRLWNRRQQRWNQKLTTFSAPIDHFLLGGPARDWVAHAPAILPYAPQDALDFNLSDHCPIKLSLTP